jgi:predicted nucleic acid-binding protein
MRDAADKDCFLTLQSLGEFFHATTRKGLADAEEAQAYIEVWQEVYSITAADSFSLNYAIEAVRDHGLSFWDAMILGAVKQANCAFILSEDMQNGRRLGGVEIVNPFLAASKPILRKLLG